MALQKRLEAEADAAEAELLASLNTGEQASGDGAVYEAEQETTKQSEPTQDEQVPEDTQQDWDTDANPYKQRNNVLQGKYNAELPRERARAEAAEARAEAAEARLQDIQSHSDDAVQQEESDYPELDERYASKKDLADLKQNEEQRMQQQKEDAHSSMLQALDVACPDWQEVNANPDFLGWLAEYDTQTGVQRQEILTQAESRGDASAIVKTISDWKATQSIQSEKPDLTRKITPANSAGSIPQGKQSYSAAEAGAYIEGRNPSYLARAGKGMDAAQFERELFAAEAEGRLI